MSLRHFKRLLHSTEQEKSARFDQSISVPKNQGALIKKVCLSQTTTTIIHDQYHNVESIENDKSTEEHVGIELLNECNILPEIELQSKIPVACSSHVKEIPVYVPNIKEKLQQWVLESNTSKNNVNKLLKILQSEGLDLPTDVRTLMNTPRSHAIIEIPPGTYIHLGLEKMLLYFIDTHKHILDNFNEINLSINSDGLPLSKSSRQQFWPILGVISNVPQLSQVVFAIGIYYSNQKKPESIESYLNMFVSEAVELINNGIKVGNKIMNVNVSNVICDSPARAFLLNVKGHNSHVGCNTCTEEGVFKDRRMTFLGVNSPLRTDTTFRSRSDEEYHKGYSPLERLPIDMIKDIPSDYMHVVLLGVMKRLLKFWVRGKKSVRLLTNKLNDCDSELKSLRDYFPSEFVRLPRGLNDIENYKGTELRNVLLYTGQIIFKGRLKKSFYLHFLKLQCAIKILVTPDLCITENDLAYKLLTEFITEYRTIYGATFITYNVHNLIHLPFYVKKHGCLDNFGAFKFENYLGIIKKKISHSRYPLQEAANRITEKMKILNTLVKNENYKLGKECEMDIKSLIIANNQGYTFYESITMNSTNYFISTKDPKNNYIMLKTHEIASVKHIVKTKDGNIFLMVCNFKSSRYFDVPIPSDIIGTVIIDLNSQSSLVQLSLNDIKYKCFVVNVSENKAISMTLSHNTFI